MYLLEGSAYSNSNFTSVCDIDYYFLFLLTEAERLPWFSLLCYTVLNIDRFVSQYTEVNYTFLCYTH